MKMNEAKKTIFKIRKKLENSNKIDYYLKKIIENIIQNFLKTPNHYSYFLIIDSIKDFLSIESDC